MVPRLWSRSQELDPFRVMRREMEDAFRAFDQKPTSADMWAGAPITAIVLSNFWDIVSGAPSQHPTVGGAGARPDHPISGHGELL